MRSHLNIPRYTFISVCCLFIYLPRPENSLYGLSRTRYTAIPYLIMLLKIASAIIINLSEGIFCLILFSCLPNLRGKTVFFFIITWSSPQILAGDILTQTFLIHGHFSKFASHPGGHSSKWTFRLNAHGCFATGISSSRNVPVT